MSSYNINQYIENQKPLKIDFPSRGSLYKDQKATINEPYKYYNWKPTLNSKCDNYDRAFYKGYDASGNNSDSDSESDIPKGINWKETEGQYKCPTDIECIHCVDGNPSLPLGVTNNVNLIKKKLTRDTYSLKDNYDEMLINKVEDSQSNFKLLVQIIVTILILIFSYITFI